MSGDRFSRLRAAGVDIEGALSLICCDCQHGPAAMRVSFHDHGAAVQQARAEQMLTSLVRLRYREYPVSLQVSSISTRFNFERGAQVGGSVKENVGLLYGNSLELSSQFSYAERPTITFGVMRGEEFVKRLLLPISLDALSLVARSGWRSGWVFRLAVQRMNEVSNAPSASGPTLRVAPDFEEFVECIQMFHQLLQSNHIRFVYRNRTDYISDPVPAEAVTGQDMVEAACAAVSLRKLPHEDAYALAKVERVLGLEFAEGNLPEAADRLRDLLHLTKDRGRFELVDATEEQVAWFDPERRRINLAIERRLAMGVMFHLSEGVQVPEEHAARGLVTTTRHADGRPFDWSTLLGDLQASRPLVLHSRRRRCRDDAEPALAAVQSAGWNDSDKGTDLDAADRELTAASRHRTGRSDNRSTEICTHRSCMASSVGCFQPL
jgi:hypothetical protein